MVAKVYWSAVITLTCFLAGEKTGQLLLQYPKPESAVSLSLNLHHFSAWYALTKLYLILTEVSLKRGILTKMFFVKKSPFASIDGNILSELPTSKEDIIVKGKEKNKLEHGLSGYGRSRPH